MDKITNGLSQSPLIRLRESCGKLYYSIAIWDNMCYNAEKELIS